VATEEPAPILETNGDAPASCVQRWSGEAMAVLGLSEFTVPYASSPAEEAEAWLRALRREGAVGRAMGELGFPDGQLVSRADPPTPRPDAVSEVRRRAAEMAQERQAASVSTVDVLFAVLDRHGQLVDRALYEHGISRQALLDNVTGGAWELAPLGRGLPAGA
jgi:hypothetical protein